MGFRGLPTADASFVLREASVIIGRIGHSKGTIRDPRGGGVSVVGAIACACGVKWERLTDDEEELISLIPPANLPRALLAWECAENAVDDLYAWEDSPDTTDKDIISMLIRCSDRMAIVTHK
jgi:hypothetical protein